MGQAYAALGDDVFGMFYNPASLSRLKQSQMAVEFVRSIADVQLGYIGLASALNPSQAMGFDIKYLDAGTAEVFDDNGGLIRSVSAERDFLGQLGYARSFRLQGFRLDGRFHTGVGAKFLKSAIAEDSSATSFAADAGGIYEFLWRGGLISIGAALSNMGAGIKYAGVTGGDSQSDPLPMTSRLALGYAGNVFEADKITLGAELDQVFHEGRTLEAIGVEYLYRRLCALRLGYRLGQDLGGLSFGFGFNFSDVSIDYGFGLIKTFNNIQQVSLNYRFTVPGIRYTNAQPPSPLETLSRNVQASISSRHYFEAAAELERVKAFFPDAAERIRLSYDLEQAVNGVLLRGPTDPRYHYALGFNSYQRGKWGEAVLNLEASSQEDPGDAEARKYLASARHKLEEQNLQLKLQAQARVATLLEIATQAFGEKDLPRALRIVNEILRLSPYQPAENLKRQIENAQRQPPPAPPQRPAPSTAPAPSAEEVAKAENLYYEALKNYADNDLAKTLSNLHEGLRFDPDNQNLKAALENIEKELRQRRKLGPLEAPAP